MVEIRAPANPWRAGRNSSGSRWVSIVDSGNGDGVLKRALSKVKPDEGGDAHFRFGKASRFTLTTPEQQTNPGSSVTWPPDDPVNDPQDGITIIDYDYIDRAVEKLRVENPDDPEQWVEIERITKIMFRNRTNGIYVRLNIDWSKAPSETTEAS
ncbi:hypothetical protein EOD10_25915 [Mesorhizobium sp. M7A.T.Ca.TU.009.01.3.2]|nr:hypothetical protein EOD10_25915 [Mesorhizobium sp. M7A.T.Ca.TU.009.01.3.2]